MGIEQYVFNNYYLILLTGRSLYIDQPIRRALSLKIFKDNSENTKPNHSNYGAHSRFYVIGVHYNNTIPSICFTHL